MFCLIFPWKVLAFYYKDGAKLFFYYWKKVIMMKFVYDSLETVKKLKHPTKKDFVNLTIAIFVSIVIAGMYFIATDTVFSGLYKRFYTIMQ